MSQDIIFDERYEAHLSFVMLADRRAPTIEGMAATQLKRAIDTHLESLPEKYREGLLGYIEAVSRTTTTPSQRRTANACSKPAA